MLSFEIRSEIKFLIWFEQAVGCLLDSGFSDGITGWLETWNSLLVPEATICSLAEWSGECPATVEFCVNRKHYHNQHAS